MNPSSKLNATSTSTQALPHLIIFRFLRVSSVSNNTLSLRWNTVEGASFYTVQLTGPEKVILEEKVPSTDKRCSTEKVIYSFKTPLVAGNDYLLTVRVDKGKSYLDSRKTNNDEEIARYVHEGIEKINKTDWSDQLQATVRAKLDGLLMDRNEAIRTFQPLVDQGSETDAICFMLYFLYKASALKSLAEADSSNEILEALIELESQLAAVSHTLGDYYRISKENSYSKAIKLALPTQNLGDLTPAPKGTLFAAPRSATSIPSHCAAWFNSSPAACCSDKYCRGYFECPGINH